MKKILTPLFCLLTTQIFAQQTTTDHFDKIVQTVGGDLNKDGLEDEVIVTQDTLNPERPYKLQIFFLQNDGSKKLIVTTNKAIKAETEASGFNMMFKDGIQITAGVLRIYEQLLRGNYTDIFRYQNGNFELIGHYDIGADGIGKSYETEFNLSTGIKIEKVVNYENNKVLSNKKTKLLIRPLPKLQDFAPYDDSY